MAGSESDRVHRPGCFRKIGATRTQAARTNKRRRAATSTRLSGRAAPGSGAAPKDALRVRPVRRWLLRMHMHMHKHKHLS